MFYRRLIKLLEILGGIRSIIQSQGFWAGLDSLAGSIKKDVLFKNEFVLVAHSIAEPGDTLKPPAGVTVREIQTEDLDLFEQFMERSDVMWYRNLLAHGRTGFIALKNGQLAAFAWLTPRIDPKIERLYVPLEPNDFYLIVIETVPAFRRQGLQRLLLNYVQQWGWERGYKRVLGLVATYNNASLGYVSHCGYQPLGRLKQVKILHLLAHFYYRPNLFGRAGDVWLMLW